MLYVRDKVAKLGNVILGGEVTSVEITEAGSVYVAQDEKGRYKKSQPVGYLGSMCRSSRPPEHTSFVEAPPPMARMLHSSSMMQML